MYSTSDFVWLAPPVKTKLAVNIPNETSFNINSAFRDELPDRVAIGYNLDELTIAIKPDENGFELPRSGNLKLPEMIRRFVEKGMVFPARFVMVREEDMWIGTLEPQKKAQADLKKLPVRKKKPDLASLAGEAARL